MPDDGTGYAVETSVLVTEGDLWQNQSNAMASLASNIEALRFSGEEGLFHDYIVHYQVLVEELGNRCREGHDRMAEISQTLIWVASLYEASEERQKEHIMSSATIR